MRDKHSEHDCEPKPLAASLLQRQPDIAHGFFTRRGGVSEGIYASLNVGSGSADSRSAIAENRRRVAAWFGLPAERLLTPHQIHSDTAIHVSAPWQTGPKQGDALVTTEKNLAIGIMTADCGAVLFADMQARVIGAAHAGWKGALNGILQNTIAAMIRLGAKAENIIAASGPSISPQNYEVGEDFRHAFINKNTAYARYFTPWAGKRHTLPRLGDAAGPKNSNAEAAQSRKLAEGKAEADTHIARQSYHCDLWAFIRDRLEETGIQVEDLRICTYADERDFFSFRRATHKAEADYGRQISAICLR